MSFFDNISDFIVDIISFFVILFYRTLGTKANQLLLKKRLSHNAKRYVKLLRQFLFGKILTDERAKSHRVELGRFLEATCENESRWWSVRIKYMKEYAAMEEHLIATVFSRNIVSVHYVGSFAETITSLHYSETASDIDMMYIYRHFNVSENIGPDDHVRMVNFGRPGYVYMKNTCSKDKLVKLYRRIALHAEFDESLHVHQLMDCFENEVLVKAKETDTDYHLRSDYFRHIHGRFNRHRFTGWLNFKQQGPASKIVWNVAGLPNRILASPMDIVFAVHSYAWPSQAEEWRQRHRNYNIPSLELISQIVSYGVDVVPKSSYKEESRSLGIFSWFDMSEYNVIQLDKSSLEWRLSFSIGEMMLVRAWTEKQLTCYRMVKTLKSDYMAHIEVSSYSMKNIMFYMIEESDPFFWRNNDLVTILDAFFDRLTVLAGIGCCPHYFVRNNNLFSAVDKTQLWELFTVCQKIKANWHYTIHASDGLWFNVEERKLTQYFSKIGALYENNQHVIPTNEDYENIMSLTASKVPHFDGTFKIYYAMKIQKELGRFIKNSYISPNYNPSVVVGAMKKYIFNIRHQTGSMEEQILFIHLCWSCVKCLRNHKKRRDDNNIASRHIDDNCDVLIEAIRTRFLSSDLAKPVMAVERLIDGDFKAAIAIIEEIATKWPNSSVLDAILNKEFAPVMLNEFDAEYLPVLKTFKFSQSAAYYCPIEVLHLLAIERCNNRDVSRMRRLLNRVERLWLDYPTNIPRINKYKCIILPLAQHIHGYLSTMI